MEENILVNPKKYEIKIELKKLFLCLGDPFGKIIIKIALMNQVKNSKKTYQAKKETILSEVFDFVLILIKDKEKFLETNAKISVFLSKKDNKMFEIGFLDIDIGELVLRNEENKEIYNQTTQLKINENYNYYNGRLEYSININEIKKMQIRSKSLNNNFKEIEENILLKKNYIRKTNSEIKKFVIEKENDNSFNEKNKDKFISRFLFSDINQKENEIDIYNELNIENNEPRIEKEKKSNFNEIYNNLKDENFKVLQENNELKLKINFLEQENLKLNTHYQAIVNNLSSMNKEIQIKIQTLENECESNTNKKCDLELDKENLLKKINELEETIHKIKFDNKDKENNFEKQKTFYENKIKEIENNFSLNLESKTQDFLLKNENTNEELKKMTIEMQKKHENIKYLEEYNENLKKQLKNKEEKIEFVENNLNSLQSDYVKNKQELAEVINLIYEKGDIDIMEEIESLITKISL